MPQVDPVQDHAAPRVPLEERGEYRNVLLLLPDGHGSFRNVPEGGDQVDPHGDDGGHGRLGRGGIHGGRDRYRRRRRGEPGGLHRSRGLSLHGGNRGTSTGLVRGIKHGTHGGRLRDRTLSGGGYRGRSRGHERAGQILLHYSVQAEWSAGQPIVVDCPQILPRLSIHLDLTGIRERIPKHALSLPNFQFLGIVVYEEVGVGLLPLLVRSQLVHELARAERQVERAHASVRHPAAGNGDGRVVLLGYGRVPSDASSPGGPLRYQNPTLVAPLESLEGAQSRPQLEVDVVGGLGVEVHAGDHEDAGVGLGAHVPDVAEGRGGSVSQLHILAGAGHDDLIVVAGGRAGGHVTGRK
mmetsp:Transcript_12445/g.26816  ORF Transcript_12445/g.26816 Transcript_12445/m.26816 type:complete len:353 (+) Transcript_12445:1659-2717(+)